jgi:hypothetical protein
VWNRLLERNRSEQPFHGTAAAHDVEHVNQTLATPSLHHLTTSPPHHLITWSPHHLGTWSLPSQASITDTPLHEADFPGNRSEEKHPAAKILEGSPGGLRQLRRVQSGRSGPSGSQQVQGEWRERDHREVPLTSYDGGFSLRPVRAPAHACRPGCLVSRSLPRGLAMPMRQRGNATGTRPIPRPAPRPRPRPGHRHRRRLMLRLRHGRRPRHGLMATSTGHRATGSGSSYSRPRLAYADTPRIPHHPGSPCHLCLLRAHRHLANGASDSDQPVLLRSAVESSSTQAVGARDPARVHSLPGRRHRHGRRGRRRHGRRHGRRRRHRHAPGRGQAHLHSWSG